MPSNSPATKNKLTLPHYQILCLYTSLKCILNKSRSSLAENRQFVQSILLLYINVLDELTSKTVEFYDYTVGIIYFDFDFGPDYG
jgi:hypothetical protein